MRPRTEALAAVGALVALGILASAAGLRERRGPAPDPRRSTFLTGPAGARGWSDALERLGVEVEHWRRRAVALEGLEGSAPRPLVAFLDPSASLDEDEASALAALAASEDGADLLLAGRGAWRAMRCFGWDVEARPDSVAVTPPGRAAGGERAPRAAWVLARPEPDSAGPAEEPERHRCTPVAATVRDTLLVTTGRRLEAVRLALQDGGSVYLVADGGLFRNRMLRESDAGPALLALVLDGGYHRVVVDEYHHGFGPGGSAWGAVRAWSVRHPVGWALWQLAAVGCLALLAGAVRFGAIQPAVRRTRRSPLEHVRALATALAAARGHDVAVRLLVQGLRRRFARPGQPLRADPRPWLAELEGSARTPEARAAVQALRTHTERSQDAPGVLATAHAVEDVWQTLTPAR